MKKTTSMLMALSMSLGSVPFAENQTPDRDFASDAKEWKVVSSNYSPGSFDQWVKDGKKIPQDMAFVGGSPRFDESTGKNRSDEEVYKIIFPELPQPEVEKPERPDPRVEEYRKLEQWLEGHKAEAAKLERDLEVKIAEANKMHQDGQMGRENLQGTVKNLVARHDAAMAGHAAERKNLESRMAELIKIPEVVICIFPPRPEPPKKFPPHWGRPPAIQTKDIRPLPGGFGQGSSTLAGWIDRNIKSDLANSNKPKPEPKRPPVVRPAKPPRPELSDEVKVELAGIETDKKALMDEMKAKLATLEKDASKEDARKAVEEFKKDNEARFAAIKEAAGKVHEELKAKRPERKERPEPPAAVKEKIAEVKKVEKTLHVARKAVTDKLKEAQDELAAKIAEAKKNPDKREVEIHVKNLVAEQAAARKAALDEFRAAQKEKHEELKAAQKELREEVRNTKEEGSSRASR